jgi:hypothetical protein
MINNGVHICIPPIAPSTFKIEMFIFGGFIKQISYVVIWFMGTLAPNRGVVWRWSVMQSDLFYFVYVCVDNVSCSSWYHNARQLFKMFILLPS